MIHVSDDTRTKMNEGAFRRTQTEIACKCWFDSKGDSIPLMIKRKDSDGRIETITEIQVLDVAKRHYAGILTVEYRCRISFNNSIDTCILVFFPENCRWVMRQ